MRELRLGQAGASRTPSSSARTAPRPPPGSSRASAVRRTSFASTPLTELEAWSDHDLEAGRRLTAPMRYDPATDKYREVGWDEAFAEIGARLHAARSEARSSSTPRAGLRSRRPTCTSCSRACTATTICPTARTCATRALRSRCPRRIGVARSARSGSTTSRSATASSSSARTSASTARACCISLQDARQRGVPIVTFNPLRERGLERFANPQSPLDMLTARPRPGSARSTTRSGLAATSRRSPASARR